MADKTIARHHRHSPRFQFNLNGLHDVRVQSHRFEEGTLYEIIGSYQVYDHVEEKVLLDTMDEDDATAMADALTTIIETLKQTDPELVETLRNPNVRCESCDKPLTQKDWLDERMCRSCMYYWSIADEAP